MQRSETGFESIELDRKMPVLQSNTHPFTRFADWNFNAAAYYANFFIRGGVAQSGVAKLIGTAASEMRERYRNLHFFLAMKIRRAIGFCSIPNR